MLTYLIRRIFQTIVYLFLAFLLIYTVLVMLMPDGPLDAYNKVKVDPSYAFTHSIPIETLQVANVDPIKDLESTYKLDKPWPINFFVWLFDPSDTTVIGYNAQNTVVTSAKGIDFNIFGWHLRGSGILTGDFGVSVRYLDNVPVSEVLGSRWVNTVLLLVCALVLALIVGILIGVVSATRQGSQLDHTLTVLSLAGLSVPPYVLGVLLILFLGIVPEAIHVQNGFSWLPWLPVGDVGSDNVQTRIAHLVLPVATLALPQIAWISRQTRFAMLDVLSQDYIRTAWAKGLSYRQVIFKHALKNTLIPIITHAAIMVPALISAVTVVETIFGYSGVGRALFRSMGGCLWADVNHTTEPPPCPISGYFPIDYPLALVLLLIMVVVVALSNVIADVLYAIADPRINYDDRVAGS
jgi:peptide/nickel transport system permease protein